MHQADNYNLLPLQTKTLGMRKALEEAIGEGSLGKPLAGSTLGSDWNMPLGRHWSNPLTEATGKVLGKPLTEATWRRVCRKVVYECTQEGIGVGP